LKKGPIPLRITGKENHGLRSVLLSNLVETIADDGKGLLPGDPFPVLAASFSPLNHGVFQTILCIHKLDAGSPFRTQGSLIGRMLRHTFDTDQFTLFDMGIDAAMGVRITDGTERF